MTIKLFITCSNVQRLWATRHLLCFVTTLTGCVSGCFLLSFSPACSCHTFSCEEPPVWSMLCSPIIIQHYKKIWCGVARTQCVPAWEWWAVVKCFAWVWTEINGGATSEQQSLFLWLFNNLSELNPCKKIIIFTIVTPLISWPLFKVQRLEGIWVQSLSREMFLFVEPHWPMSHSFKSFKKASI